MTSMCESGLTMNGTGWAGARTFKIKREFIEDGSRLMIASEAFYVELKP